MQRLLIDVRRAANLESARELRHLLTRVSEAAGIPKQMLSMMTLAASETLTNIVEHGDPAASWMGLKLEQAGETWRAEFRDDGGPWSPETASAGGQDDTWGRGLNLVLAGCESVAYSRDDPAGCNVAVLIWHAPEPIPVPRLMIVEDNAAQRALYEAYLSPHYDLTILESGEEALRSFEMQRPDLVISDLRMPGMDGLSLREHLVTVSDGALTAFIVLTGDGDRDLAQRAISLGVDDYLLKPVDGTRLRRAVERVLNRNRQLRHRLGQRIASRITSTLVPDLPRSIPGWHHALAVRDTGEGGGDLLLHHEDEQHTHLLLLDIMGHDETAKFFAHACAGYLRGLMKGLKGVQDPALLLESLSEAAFEDDLLAQTLFTCIIVTLMADGHVRVASAGHPPALTVRGRRVETVGELGMLPGLQAGIEYRSEELTLRPGERLAIYTDGLFENAASETQRKALTDDVQDCFVKSQGVELSRTLREMMQRFDAHAHDTLKDDALLLLLEPA